ncbi:hypothetical protein ABH940_005567 [Streptacidiphilus sp. BW17]|uniref:hypothetical protein n=1 Tax=Streptacidiphilus sp. BW17 TaxID=3156274 RepID=UPI0035118449
MTRHTQRDLRALADQIESLGTDLVFPSPEDDAPDVVELLRQQEAMTRLHQTTSRHALVRARRSRTAAEPFAVACTHLSYALADLSLAIEHTLRQDSASPGPGGSAVPPPLAIERHAHRALARAHNRLDDAIETLRDSAHALVVPSPTAPERAPWAGFADALAAARPVTVRIPAEARLLTGAGR